jgi:hypothetical protein
MKYSNGYDMDAVLPALTGRLAWRSDDETSASGRYFEDFHALCRLDNLKSTIEIDADIDDYLSSLQSSVIARCLNGVLNETEFIEEVWLHDRIINSQDTPIENGAAFCGYRIKIPKAFDKSVWIRSATLFFDSVKSFKLYLFQEGKQSPIQSFDVTSEANGKASVDFQNLVLSYSVYKGDVFYLGYFQSDLGTTKALQEQVCENKTLCFGAMPCIAQATGSTSFNQKYVALNTYPYGLNLEVATFNDFTGVVKKNAFLFDELQGLCMAYAVLDQIRMNTRSNGTERKLQEVFDPVTIQMELNGAAPISDGPKIKGLSERIEREMQRVKQSFYPKQKAVIHSLCS